MYGSDGDAKPGRFGKAVGVPVVLPLGDLGGQLLLEVAEGGYDGGAEFLGELKNNEGELKVINFK